MRRYLAILTAFVLLASTAFPLASTAFPQGSEVIKAARKKSSGGGGCTGGGANGYAECVTLTIASGQVGGSLTNYATPFCFNMTLGNGATCPTVADLKTVANGGAVNNTVTFNGQTCPADINFYSNSAGTSALNWDCDYYNATTGAFLGKSEQSVTTSANVYYLFIGKSSQTTYTGGALGAAYNANYVGVYHFPNGTTWSGNDSTSNANTGTGSPSAQTGQLDGSELGIVALGNTTLHLTTLTIEAWVYPTSLPTNGQIMSKGYDGTNTEWQFESVSGGHLSCGTNSSGISSSTGTISVNTWALVGCTYDGTTWRIYINGSVDATTSTSAGPNSTAQQILIGGIEDQGTPIQNFDGNIDEDVYLNNAQAAAFFTTEMNAESAPSTFFSASAPSP